MTAVQCCGLAVSFEFSSSIDELVRALIVASDMPELEAVSLESCRPGTESQPSV